MCLPWIEDPEDEFRANFTDAFQFFATRPFLPSLSERRGHFRAGRRLKLERGGRNRRARLVRIRRDDAVAVRQ